jgi:hypothetical protein
MYKGVLPNYIYAVSTANSNLHTHLESYHKKEYVQVCEQNGWGLQLPKHKWHLELANLLKQSTLDGIAVHANCILHHLINFIVADDQVAYPICCMMILSFIFLSSH